ncbi:TetR/AcrR family transcriptional regulator [Streptomyces boncukensis]|uniref:TetR/AcrR family transcriptional regulator n=1 Tax=Streptomyces boncukensis TaxID=2711219 RepID=A0A6G4WSS9_9ACTN|nr:TetR/AcrR family transcriptional regulator [Streptomyces boncukensis]NGO67604.1 TetR/AcrR family transcriptional regulator [Streptomyces boncukensis]
MTSAPSRGQVGKRAEAVGGTRERLLAVAMDLFTKQGYGGTSLREIAERLDVSKAAIYYHFRTKEDIARAIVEQIMEVNRGIADRLTVAGKDSPAWQRAFDQIIEIALANRGLFMVWDRNDDAFQKLFADDPVLGPQIEATGEPLGALFADPELPPSDRIRLGCAFGAMMGPLVMYTNFYEDLSADTLREHIRSTVATLLQG